MEPKQETKTQEVFEYIFPHGSIRKFSLQKLNPYAIVKSFHEDIMYFITDCPDEVESRIQQICGRKIWYSCTAVAKGA